MKKLERDRRTNITPENVVEFEKSEIVRKAIKLIGESSMGQRLALKISLLLLGTSR